MSLLAIVILCLVQGLTEFLPVSSSGHLIVFPHLLGWQDQGLAFDVAVHVGTLGAVLCYFRSEVTSMIRSTVQYCLSGFSRQAFDDFTYLALSLVIATIPAVIFGYFIKKYLVEDIRSVKLIAYTMIFFGGVLFLSDRLGKTVKTLQHMTLKKGFVIGLAQVLALIPGTSRSGICISAARALGFQRVDAVRYAFLMSIPVILAGAILTTYDAFQQGIAVSAFEIGMGIALAVLFGLGAIHFMLKYLVRHSLTPFVLYRLALGGFLLSLV